MAKYVSLHWSNMARVAVSDEHHTGPVKQVTRPHVTLICHILYLLNIIIIKVTKVMTEKWSSSEP